jgi:putative ABC transport system permease protein
MGRLAGPQRLNLILLGIFACIAIVLAAVGIYGVMSYSVTQRTHEMGIRMALGASPGEVVTLVLRSGKGFALAGVAIGVGVSFAVTRLMAGLLFGVNSTDPLTFASVSRLLILVALLARIYRLGGRPGSTRLAPFATSERR